MKALVAVAILITSAPLVAAAAEDGASSAPKERLICRRRAGAPSSDSRLGSQRICRTAAQWRQISDTSVDDSMDNLAPATQAISSPADGYSNAGRGGPTTAPQ